MDSLQILKNFNLQEASVVLWTFRGPTGSSNEAPRYSGKWVDTSDDVDTALKEAINTERMRIEEVLQYSLLAQNHESSALTITTEETHAPLIISASNEETQTNKAIEEKHLLNTKFYVIKLIQGDTIIYGVKKTDSSWLTKNRIGSRNFFFHDNRLAIDNRPHFQISKGIDFFIIGENVLCLNKSSFETVVRYKETHIQDLGTLLNDQNFINVFAEMQPLVDYIGQNKIQLRRASAIKQKAHFLDQGFMTRLQTTQAQYGFNIQFDQNGKILATNETASQIMTALLDHRLTSGFSQLIYDVQNTTAIQV